MSIRLPRQHKELHFTGSVRALGPERPAPVSALGQERPKPPPLPPPSRSAAIPAPAPAPPPSRVTTPTKLTTVRGSLASFDDEILTEALDREMINAALFPIARRENASSPPPNLPVPHFRSAADAQAHHAEPRTITRPPKPAAFPLGVWLITALFFGIVSYQLAPQAAHGLSRVVRVADE